MNPEPIAALFLLVSFLYANFKFPLIYNHFSNLSDYVGFCSPSLVKIFLGSYIILPQLLFYITGYNNDIYLSQLALLRQKYALESFLYLLDSFYLFELGLDLDNTYPIYKIVILILVLVANSAHAIFIFAIMHHVAMRPGNAKYEREIFTFQIQHLNLISLFLCNLPFVVVRVWGASQDITNLQLWIIKNTICIIRSFGYFHSRHQQHNSVTNTVKQTNQNS